MLVLTRKSGEGIWIGDDIRVVVIKAEEGQVRLGIEARQDLPVHRDEIYRRIQEENKRASSVSPEDISKTMELINPLQNDREEK